MRTPKENNKGATVDDLQETLKNNGAGALITEAELGELLRKNGAPTDEEIAERLEELRAIKHTPEEEKEKARLEKVIQDAEDQLAEVTMQMEAIKKAHAQTYSVPGSAVEEYQMLKEKKRNISNIIETAANDIRNISNGKNINRKNNNDYMVEYGKCFNRMTELEKTMKNCEASGDLTGYEDAKIKFFSEKSKLKTIEQNKPKKVNEMPDVAQKRNALQKAIRKNALVKILFYSGLIDKAISEARQAELNAVNIADTIGWEKYRQTNKSMFDESYWVNSFYTGIDTPYNAAEIKHQISELK